jgi:hypothetical protein
MSSDTNISSFPLAKLSFAAAVWRKVVSVVTSLEKKTTTK